MSKHLSIDVHKWNSKILKLVHKLQKNALIQRLLCQRRRELTVLCVGRSGSASFTVCLRIRKIVSSSLEFHDLFTLERLTLGFLVSYFLYTQKDIVKIVKTQIGTIFLYVCRIYLFLFLFACRKTFWYHFLFPQSKVVQFSWAISARRRAAAWLSCLNAL